MKKALYVVVSIITAGIWISGCSNGGGGGNSEKFREDTLNIADTMGRAGIVEVVDSAVAGYEIEQDAIENASSGLTPETFIKKIDLLSVNKIESNLKSLGFELKNTQKRKEEDPFPDPEGPDDQYILVTYKTYIKTIGDQTTKVVVIYNPDYYDSVEINFPNSQEKKEFNQSLKKLFRGVKDKCDLNIGISNMGNTIQINGYNFCGD